MYNLFYNLNDRPFSSKPDLKYFCTTLPHKRAIVHMQVGFDQPDGILVLTGEKGIGKTTLISHMLNQLDKKDNIVAFIHKVPQKDVDFLPAILSALQIHNTSNEPKVLFNALHNFMLEQANLKKKVRLVFDNAEGLSHYCLELLRLLSSTLQMNEHGLLQIVLVGTNELETVLSANENQSFGQQISMSYCIQPLQALDTRQYIEHRLKVAGWNGSPIIAEEAFTTIHQLTGGIPYEINRYCDRLLMLGMLRKTPQITNADVSSLTPEKMEKLDEFEAVRLEQDKRNESPDAIEQPIPLKPKRVKSAPVQQAVKGVDVENIIFEAPVKKSNLFFNKQTLMTIAGAYLIASISIFAYNKMSEVNPGNHSVTNAGHSEVKATSVVSKHSAVNDHSAASSHSPVKSHSGTADHSAVGASSESGSGQIKYVLNEIPSEHIADAKLGDAAAEARLLDIQSLLKKNRSWNSEVRNNYSDASKDTEAWQVGASGLPIGSAPTSHSTKVASN